MKKQKLFIDSCSGGNGDIWMRLISFYVAAALLPAVEIHVRIPEFLKRLANHTFSDRLSIADHKKNEKIDLSYTSLGLHDLLKGIMNGKRYIAPYHRAVIHDKKKLGFKDLINITAFNIAECLNLVHLPAWRWITTYQGYLDIAGLKAFKKISYQQFVDQLCRDYPVIYSRLNSDIPISDELSFPADLEKNIIVFPTGTSRQFMPVQWAKTYLPDAYFALFHKDEESELFQKHGLKTVHFFEEPGDIIALSNKAKWTISTDSFPSHLLQYSNKKCTITITEVLKSRIISPSFKGKIVDAEVKCHPCLHLARKTKPTCIAGYEECLNWKNKIYTENILNSLS
jgi:hypothetical protein